MHTPSRIGRISTLPVILLLASAASWAAPKPPSEPSAAIPIAEVKLAERVNFARDVLPIFRSNCLACHNARESKGGLVLETPKAIRTGGDSGPAAIAGKAMDSLILRAASHREKPFMPPRNNKVSAAVLTPEQLGVLKTWIDEGAGGDETLRAAPIRWHALPSILNPIYAVALSPDGQFAACSRANQIFIYDLPARRLVTRLSDPSLALPGEQNGVAHRDLVQSLAFSPDGKTLASGGYREVKFWSRPQPAILATIAEAHATVPSSMVQSPNGKVLAVAGEDRIIRLFSLPSGKKLHELKGHTGAITALAYGDGGATLYSASLDKSVRIWKTSPDAGEPVVIETPSEVLAVTVLGSGKMVTAGADKTMRIWTGGKEIKQLPKLQGTVIALAALPGGNDSFIAAFKEGQVRLWDDAGEKIRRNFDSAGEISSVVVSADGKRIACVGQGKTARIISIEGNRDTVPARIDREASDKVRLLELKLAFANNEVTFAQRQIQEAATRQTTDTQSIARGKNDLAAAEKTMIDAKKNADARAKAKIAADKELADADLEITRTTKAREEAAAVLTAAKAAVEDYRPKRDKARAAVDSAGKAQAQEAAANFAAAQKTYDGLKAKSDSATQAQNVAEQKFNAAMNKRPGIEQRAREAGRVAVESDTLAMQAEIGFNSAKKNLAAAQVSLEQAGRELAEGNAARKVAEDLVSKARSDLDAAQKALQMAGSPMTGVTFTADGASVLITAADGAIRVFSAETGQPAPTIPDASAKAQPGTAICCGAQGFVAVAAVDGSIRIWDVAGQWTLARTLGGSEDSPLVSRVCSLAFSPDGALLATGSGIPSRSGELKLWNAADGSLAREIVDAHSDSVLGLSFSADGKYLASCSADRFMKVFSTADGKLFRAYEGTTDQVLGVSYRYDGRSLVTGGADNRLRFWNRLTGEQLEQREKPYPLQVTSVSYIGMSTIAVVTMGDGTVRECTDQGTVRRFEPVDTFLYCSAVTPDGQYIIAGGQDSILRLWDTRSGQPPVTFDPPPAGQ